MTQFALKGPLEVPTHLIFNVASILENTQNNRTVMMQYRDEHGHVTVREVEVKDLEPKNGTILMHTWDSGRVDHRTFRVDRILNVWPGNPLPQENYKERTIRLAREFVQSKGVDVANAEAGVTWNYDGDRIIRVGFRIGETNNAFTVLAQSYDDMENPTRILVADIEVYTGFF